MNTACERVRELAAELALGIADGEDRARALEHLADCPGCRARLERFSTLADELLLLAPAHEPPGGFENRAGDAMRPAPRRPGLRRRFVMPVAAALGAAALAAGAVWIGFSDDRELADSYRDTLAIADGEYFDAAPLELPGGNQVGYVYGYQGRASWVLALVYKGVEAGRYRLELVTDAGEKLPLSELEVARGEGSTGATTPVDYERVTEVRLLDERGREIADSELRE